MTYPWSSFGDDAVHLPTLGRMAACNRMVRGEDGLAPRAARTGLTEGQLDMLERGLIVAPGTIEAVLKDCGYHRDQFARKHLGPVLEKLNRCAVINSREAQRAAIKQQVAP
jgi:hypothetical protein